MHPNPAFRGTPLETNLAFARDRGFGLLAIGAPDGPLAAHVPFLIAEDGTSLDLHLARSNPVARAPLPLQALMAVSGPDGYISPDWYDLEDQVPTWNYVAVHLRGSLRQLPQDMLRAHVDALSARFEAGLAPKLPWTSAKMTDGVMDRMMRMIIPFRITIESVEGTWKLNQNKTPAARLGAAKALADQPAALSPAALAALMRSVPES